MKEHKTTGGDRFLSNHIHSASWSNNNRRRASRIPGEILDADRAARFLTLSAIALGILILLAVLSIPFF